MKTYPINRDDGTLHAFEIKNTWVSMAAIKSILLSIPDVESLKRQLNSDDRIEFIYKGIPWVVNEPWGDNSRYWIGPKEPENHTFDVAPINEAFSKYKNPIIRAWEFARNVVSGKEIA